MLDSNFYQGNAERGGPGDTWQTHALHPGLDPAGGRQGQGQGGCPHRGPPPQPRGPLLSHSPGLYPRQTPPRVLALFKELGIGLSLTGHVHIQDAVQDRGERVMRYLPPTPSRSGPTSTAYSPSGPTAASGTGPRSSMWKPGPGRRALRIPISCPSPRSPRRPFARASVELSNSTLGQGLGRKPGGPGWPPRLWRASISAILPAAEEENARDIEGSEGLALLEDSPSPFIPAYARSILRDNSLDDNSVDILPRD